MNISEFKAQNPDYKDVPDLELADALHAKFYSETPRADFLKSVGLAGEQSNHFTQSEPRAQYQQEFLAMNPQAGQDALEMAMAQYDTAQQKRGAASTDGVADRFRQMQSPEATFNAKLEKKLQGDRRGVVPPLPGKLQPDNPVVKPPHADPSALETVGSGIIGGAMSTLAGAGAAGASMVGADETAHGLDMARKDIEGRMHELGGESIIGKASALVGGVGTVLAVPQETVMQLVANAGLFAIPAFRDTYKAQLAQGRSEPLALAHAAEAFGINLFMPTVAAHGMGAVAGKLGTDGLMGVKGAAAGLGQAAAEGVGFSTVNSVLDKGTDLIAGQKNERDWLNPHDMAAQALGFGALRAGHRIAGGEPVHNRIAGEIEGVNLSHRGTEAEALRALDPNHGAAIDPIDTVKPFVPTAAPAAVPGAAPAADDGLITAQLQSIRPLDKARADLEAAKHESVMSAVAKDPELSAKTVMDAPDLDSALAAAQAIIDAPLPGLNRTATEGADHVNTNADGLSVRDGRNSGIEASEARGAGEPAGDALDPQHLAEGRSGISGEPLRSPATAVAGAVEAANARPALTAPTQFRTGGAHAEENHVPGGKLESTVAAVDGGAAARVDQRGTAAPAEVANAGTGQGNRATGDVQEAPPAVKGDWRDQVAAKESRLQEQLRVANEHAAARAKAKQESEQAAAPALKKPQSQGERMRAKLHDSDPFLGFLAKNGVSIEDKGDVGAERGNRGNRMVPGYGPVFRKNGLRLDELALRAAEEGHLTQADIDSAHDTGGTGKLAEMIRRAVADKEVVHDTAEPELSPHDIELMHEARRIGVDTDGLTPDQVYDAVKAHHEAAEQAAEAQVRLVSEDELWSEYERMLDAYHRHQAEITTTQGARSDAARGGADDLAQGNAEARAHGAESADFALSGETLAEGRTRVAEQERAAAESKSKQTDSERRAQADSERDSFALTGSDRAADVGAAHGQGDLLAEKSSAKDVAEQSPVLPSGNAKVAEKTASEIDDGADIPHAFMKKTKVPHDVWVVDEGQYETVDIPAHTALKSVREDIANLAALLNCMRGG
jgi:hypothetical protein